MVNPILKLGCGYLPRQTLFPHNDGFVLPLFESVRLDRPDFHPGVEESKGTVPPLDKTNNP